MVSDLGANIVTGSCFIHLGFTDSLPLCLDRVCVSAMLEILCGGHLLENDALARHNLLFLEIEVII